MKKAIAIIVAMLFVFAIASLAIAAEEKKAAPAPAEKKAEPAKPAEKKAVPKQVTGDIKAIDKDKKEITVTKKVKDKVTDTVVAVDDKTKIMEGKDKKAFADLKAGDKVKVVYEEKDGKNIANSIMIQKVEKKAEPAKPAEKKAEPAKPVEKK